MMTLLLPLACSTWADTQCTLHYPFHPPLFPSISPPPHLGKLRVPPPHIVAVVVRYLEKGENAIFLFKAQGLAGLL